MNDAGCLWWKMFVKMFGTSSRPTVRLKKFSFVSFINFMTFLRLFKTLFESFFEKLNVLNFPRVLKK